MRRALLLALAFVLLAAGRADATVLGYQSDPELCADTAHTLDVMAGPANGKWLRLMVQPDRPDLQDCYLRAVQGAHARHLQVFVTLLRWKGIHGTEKPGVKPQEWATATAHQVRRLGPWVDAWSPLNEPNHPAFAPSVGPTRCKRQQVTTHHKQLIKVVRYRHAKRGKYRKRHHHYVRARKRWHGKRYKRIAFWRNEMVSLDHAYRHCEATYVGIAYRHVYDVAAAQVRALDPSALLIVGDMAPTGDDRFIRAFWSASRAPVQADVLGLHYGDAYRPQFYAFAKAHGLVVWATEWAQTPGSGGDQRGLSANLRRMQGLGAQVAIWYSLFGKPGAFWNTGLLHAGDVAQPGYAEAQKWN